MTYPGTLLLGVAIGVFATLVGLVGITLTLWGLWSLCQKLGWVHHSTYTVQTVSGPMPPHQEERL